MTILLLLPIALFILFGLISLLASRLPRVSHLVGWLGAFAAGALGLSLTIVSLVRGDSTAISVPWNPVIGSSFAVGFDPLSGFFLLPVYGLSAVCALFGAGYMAHSPRGRGAHWLFYGLLAASMAMAVLARNAVLFLMAWEVMALSSWLLVTHEHETEEVRQAGITYLVATQIGTAFLLVMFLVLGRFGFTDTGAEAALDFSRFTGMGGPVAAAVFVLALVGFGTKAGIVPLHVWLPEAHPAAPSHVSALMSGVMIKTGIYGLLRVLSFLGFPRPGGAGRSWPSGACPASWECSLPLPSTTSKGSLPTTAWKTSASSAWASASACSERPMAPRQSPRSGTRARSCTS